RLSGGRFIFGIGGGWNVEEMENHAARYASRFRLLRERVLAMRALWTQEQAEFHGEFVDFDPVWLNPKPKRTPHPPVFLGGESAQLAFRAGTSSATGGSPACAATGSPRVPSPACVKQQPRLVAIRQHCRLQCSMRQPNRVRLRPIARRASSGCCSRRRTPTGTKCCNVSTPLRRS